MKVAKKVCLVMVLFFAAATLTLAGPEGWRNHDDEEDQKKPEAICPATRMGDSCTSCHTTPNFKLREGEPFEGHDFPHGVKMVKRDDAWVVYYNCETVNPDGFERMFNYLNRHPELPRKIIIEVDGPGGEVFGGWRSVNIILNNWDKYEIETHLLGVAASAHFLIFQAGEKRVMSERATCMWHLASYAEWISINTAASLNDKKEMMDQIQNSADHWLAERSGKMTFEEIQAKIKDNRIGWWFGGKEALTAGFADGLL
jgi:ATP-dependent protease ClpP protease subunit